MSAHGRSDNECVLKHIITDQKHVRNDSYEQPVFTNGTITAYVT